MLRREQEFVHAKMARLFSFGRGDQEGAIRANRDLSTFRQGNVRAQIDGDFGRRHAQPEKDRLKSKSGNHLTAIAEKEGHMNPIRDLFREIDKAGSGNEAYFFAWLASNAGKLHQVTALARDLREALNLRSRRIRIRRGG